MTSVVGSNLLKRAVLMLGISFKIATVSGQHSQVEVTQVLLEISVAGKVCRRGKTVQLPIPPTE